MVAILDGLGGTSTGTLEGVGNSSPRVGTRFLSSARPVDWIGITCVVVIPLGSPASRMVCNTSLLSPGALMGICRLENSCLGPGALP